MLKKVHIFLGATVADAAARPLHWIYDKKKLKSYIKNKKIITFFKENRCPFYSIKTGEVSGYNAVGQVMFKTLINTQQQNKIITNFKKNIIKNFGPGSRYWKNLKLRKKYKKIKWTTAMKGPWIHQNILETIKNIKLKKTVTGGTKVNESDGYCAALPYSLFDSSDSKLKKIIRTVANGKISEQFALAKLKIINLADEGNKDPINLFIKLNSKSNYFKNVIENIRKVKKLKNKPHNIAVKEFGKACSYPGTFNGSIHAIITSKNYKNAIIKTIKAGGCNCSRANFVGAYFAAKNGIKSIPKDWIKKTNPAKNILKYIV